MDKEVSYNAKELASARTRILLIDDRPGIVSPLVQHLKTNGKFSSVEVFAVSSQTTNTESYLEGNYDVLRQRIQDSLKDGENLIVLSDYSFDRTDFQHSEQNGINWTQRLSKDFAAEKNSAQISIFGHTDAHLQNESVGELFIESGASGMIPKKTEPKDVLSLVESTAVLGRINYLLNTDNLEVIKLLTNEVLSQIIPGTDSKSGLVRHNIKGILGYAIASENSPIKRDINVKEIRQLLSMLEDFYGVLDLGGGQYLQNVIGESFIFDKKFIKFSTSEEIRLDKYLNPPIASFLTNFTNLLESNMWDSMKASNTTGFGYSLDHFIIPYLFIEDGNLIVAFANNGPLMDKKIFDNLGSRGVTTKGEGRGTGLASAAQIADEMGLGISVIQVGGGVNHHNLVTKANSSIEYYDHFEDKVAERVKETLLGNINDYQQKNFRKYNHAFGVSFMVSIPLGKVYKK